MRLVSFAGADGAARMGALAGGRILDTALAATATLGEAPAWARSTLAWLEAEPADRERLGALVEAAGDAPPEALLDPGAVRLLAPVPRPPTIRDGMGFERHVLEATRSVGLGPLAGLDRRLERAVGGRRTLAGLLNRSFYERPPHYFSNPHSVVGTGADVRIPAGCERFDYELEWGAFVGRAGRDIPLARAREHIAGYALYNDFSARDIQFAEMRGRLGPGKGKSFDTGNAIGPWLVTPDEVGDPDAVVLSARVNGAEWSRARAGEAHWTLDELIARISRSETLMPGDFVGSGTASGRDGLGCGLELGRWLEAGDVVELAAEPLGVLRNRVVR